jgi:predicted aconitase with swiveling domain
MEFAQFAQPIYATEDLKACEAIVCHIPMVSSLDELFHCLSKAINTRP